MRTATIRWPHRRTLAWTSSRARDWPKRSRALVHRFLSAKGDPRPVVADVHAPYYGIEVNERALIPGDNSRVGTTRFADWLSQSAGQAGNQHNSGGSGVSAGGSR